MKANNMNQYAALIGLDWADKKHDVCIMPTDTGIFEYDQFCHSPEAIKIWALSLHQRFPDQQIAICLELKNGPIVSALLNYAWFDLFPVAPATLAKYRQAFTHSGAKDDPSDAFLMVDFMQRHDDKLRVIKPDDDETRILKRFVGQRRSLIAEKVRLTNRITRELKDYYPQPLEWFDDRDTVLFCDFIEQWPNLNKVKRAHENTLINFFHQRHVRSEKKVNERLEAIKSSLALTERTLSEVCIMPDRAVKGRAKCHCRV